jgi:hypothetical protein
MTALSYFTLADLCDHKLGISDVCMSNVRTDGLQKEGYSRKGSENVVGPMPSMGTVIKSGDDMWKIIAWIRSVNPSSLQAPVPTPPQ